MRLAHHAAQEALIRLNAVRSKFGGSTFSMGQIKGLVGFGGSASRRTSVLTEWADVYSAWGPLMEEVDLDLNEADRRFQMSKSGSGPEAWNEYWSNQFVEDVETFFVDGLIDEAQRERLRSEVACIFSHKST